MSAMRVLGAVAAAAAVCVAAAQDGQQQETAPKPTVRERVASEAAAAKEVAETDLGRAFLAAADDLPPMAEARTVYFRRGDARAITPETWEQLPEEERAAFQLVEVSEAWYYSLYSTPIAYLRAIDLAAQAGLTNVDGKRLADFGFGNLGQLRMLASLGADVVGIESDHTHEAIFRMPEDEGEVARSPEAGEGEPGSVSLVFGHYPASEEIIAEVGGGLSLFMSKNTLKKGYIHPEREADPKLLVHLGVDDETYVRTVHEALEPGGLFVIYNLYPKPAGQDEPYKPWASGECPFERALVEAAGFEVIHWNVDDSEKARHMGRLLGWDDGMTAEEFNDGFNAMVTILRKPHAASSPAAPAARE